MRIVKTDKRKETAGQNQNENLVAEELEILVKFLGESPEEAVVQAADYICGRLKLNIEKIKGTDWGERFLPAVCALIVRISPYLKDSFFADKESFLEVMKHRNDIYLRDEASARKIADDFGGEIKTPDNLRFIENAVAVVLCSNEEFAPYLSVTLQSLLDFSNPQRKYHFIILARGFCAETKRHLSEQAANFKHCRIDIVDAASALDGIALVSTVCTDMFSRLFIPYWLDKYPKVVYLDSDVILKADIAELYDCDISPFCLGAVKNATVSYFLSKKNYNIFFSFSPAAFISLKDWQRYFNSGVLLFDTKKFREKISADKLFRFALYYTNRYKKRFNDQDVLNLLTEGEYFDLPSEWNYLAGSPTEFQASKETAKLIHFNGPKPWTEHSFKANKSESKDYVEYAENLPLFKKKHGKLSKTQTENFTQSVAPAIPPNALTLGHLDVHLAEHCNLNCAYCCHCSAVAEPEFLDIAQYQKDMAKLSQLTGGRIDEIWLLGGEPLLNPDIARIIRITRQNIPFGKICVLTNGILLAQTGDDFWRACFENAAFVSISRYPINLDADKILSVAKKHGVEVFNYGSKTRNFRSDVFRVQKFDMAANRDIQKAYGNCPCKSPFLRDAKIYRCPSIPSSRHLQKRFDVKFSVSQDDFLALDKVDDLREITDFLSRPSPFCRYCFYENGLVEWKISEKKKEEWIIEETRRIAD